MYQLMYLIQPITFDLSINLCKYGVILTVKVTIKYNLVFNNTLWILLHCTFQHSSKICCTITTIANLTVNTATTGAIEDIPRNLASIGFDFNVEFALYGSEVLVSFLYYFLNFLIGLVYRMQVIWLWFMIVRCCFMLIFNWYWWYWLRYHRNCIKKYCSMAIWHII